MMNVFLITSLGVRFHNLGRISSLHSSPSLILHLLEDSVELFLPLWIIYNPFPMQLVYSKSVLLKQCNLFFIRFIAWLGHIHSFIGLQSSLIYARAVSFYSTLLFYSPPQLFTPNPYPTWTVTLVKLSPYLCTNWWRLYSVMFLYMFKFTYDIEY